MADAKLSALTEAASLSTTDYLYAVVSGASRKITPATLLSLAPTADISIILGEAVGVGDALHLKADGKAYLAKADAAATLPAVLVAIEGGELGDAIDARAFGRVTWAASPGWTPGAPVYASAATAGALTQTAPTTPGEFVQLVGLALAANQLLLAPQLVAVEVGT